MRAAFMRGSYCTMAAAACRRRCWYRSSRVGSTMHWQQRSSGARAKLRVPACLLLCYIANGPRARLRAPQPVRHSLSICRIRTAALWLCSAQPGYGDTHTHSTHICLHLRTHHVVPPLVVAYARLISCWPGGGVRFQDLPMRARLQVWRAHVQPPGGRFKQVQTPPPVLWAPPP